MVARRLIACLDVDEGRVLKGKSFVDLQPAGDPVDLARRYGREGIDELAVLDITATLGGRRGIAGVVRALARRLFIPLLVGGGLRSLDDARAAIDAGADKVSINSAALARPDLIDEIARTYGSQAVVVAIDARRGARGFDVFSRSATRRHERDAAGWAREAAERGAGEILLTSIDRDGTKQGFDCSLIGAVSGAVTIPVIASGGAGEPRHFADVFSAGADAALAASIFHFGDHAVRDVKTYLASHGVSVRLDWQSC